MQNTVGKCVDISRKNKIKKIFFGAFDCMQMNHCHIVYYERCMIEIS